MITSCANRGTEDVHEGADTKAARKVCPQQLWAVAQRKLDAVKAAVRLGDLKAPPGNHLEKLKDDRAGQWSIRINQQYRVCFRWADESAHEVEIVDVH